MKYVHRNNVFDENLALWHFYGCKCAPPTLMESAQEYDEVLRTPPCIPRSNTRAQLFIRTPIVDDLLLWFRAGGIMYDIYPFPELPEHPTEYEGDAPATCERRARHRDYLMEWFYSHADYVRSTLMRQIPNT